jgi:electron transport complex protein RnfB
MATKEKVYCDLQKHLDSFPIGYPATKSGVEIRLLKRFFTPEEAETAIQLSMVPEPVEHIYERVKKRGMSLEKLRDTLDRMVSKGCILTRTAGGQKLYSNALFVVGIFEFQVNRLTPDLVQDYRQYAREGFSQELFRVKTPQLRTIPVEKGIPIPEKYQVSTYDNVRELIKNNAGQIAVGNCICRQVRDLTGAKCTSTDLREICLVLDGEQYISMGLGRPITKEEALNILEKAQEAGLVLQPANSQRPEYICCCCGDCCAILSTIKKFPRPADYYATNFYAAVDPELCVGCQVCIQRCQMDARSMSDGKATVNLDRCIGCGNCVVTCKGNASQLKKKESELVPPQNAGELYVKIATQKAGR